MMCRKISEIKIQSSFGGFGVGSANKFNRDLLEPDIQNREVALSVCVNNICSHKCGHCVAKKSRNLDDNFEAIEGELKGLDSAELGKISFASFAGLEPTETSNRVYELADFFHQNNIQTILMTNGIRLDSQMQIDLSGRIDFLDPSIDGLKGTCKPALNKKGDYSDAWKNIKQAISSGFTKKTGIIVTAREETINELPELFHFFEEELGRNESASSTLWFYLGTDLLPKDSFMRAIKAAVQSPYRQMQIAIPGDYNNYIPNIFAEFGPSDLRYCSQTGIPSFLIEGKKIFFPSLADGGATLLRIEPDGELYLGCGHLHGSSDNHLGPIECLGEIISSF